MDNHEGAWVITPDDRIPEDTATHLTGICDALARSNYRPRVGTKRHSSGIINVFVLEDDGTTPEAYLNTHDCFKEMPIEA